MALLCEAGLYPQDISNELERRSGRRKVEIPGAFACRETCGKEHKMPNCIVSVPEKNKKPSRTDIQNRKNP